MPERGLKKRKHEPLPPVIFTLTPSYDFHILRDHPGKVGSYQPASRASRAEVLSSAAESIEYRRSDYGGDHTERKAAFKFGFWLVASVALFGYIIHTYTSGQMIQWYYYTASLDGYAVDANLSMNATKDKPVVLNIAKQDEVKGLVAIPVAKGDRLPKNANGVISLAELKAGKRAVLEGQTIKVTVPWQIKETKGVQVQGHLQTQGDQDQSLVRRLERGHGALPWAIAWSACRRVHRHPGLKARQDPARSLKGGEDYVRFRYRRSSSSLFLAGSGRSHGGHRGRIHRRGRRIHGDPGPDRFRVPRLHGLRH